MTQSRVAFLLQGRTPMLTEVSILRQFHGGPDGLRAWAALVFDAAFVVHDLRVIETKEQAWLVCMPNRKRTRHCIRCNALSSLRDHFCGHCGLAQDPLELESRREAYRDIAHPTSTASREAIADVVLAAYREIDPADGRAVWHRWRISWNFTDGGRRWTRSDGFRLDPLPDTPRDEIHR